MANKTQKEEAVRLKALYQAKAFELNLTHEKVAKIMQIKQGSVSHFLNGRNPLPLKRAKQFAEILKCDISDFSERLANEAATFGIAVGDSVFVDVVLLNMDKKEIIKKIKGKKVFNVQGSELIYWPKPHSAETLALTVEGEEAEPRIPSGSLAFVDTKELGKKGDLVMIIKGTQELVFAELTGNGYAQYPNLDYPDRVFKLNDPKVKIAGKVIGHQTYL